MAPRSMWRGGVSLGMVTFPVSAYKATDDREGITLNELHKGCGERVKRPKVCPIHGEITVDQVMKGVEVGPGNYVTFDESELDSIRTPSDRVLNIEQFVPAGSVPFAKADHYLGTDPLGAAGYSLMRDAMRELDVEAVTRITIRSREHLATIRVFDDLLVLTTHYWPDEVRSHDGLVALPKRAVTPAEIALATQLISGMTSEFDPTTQVDAYTKALKSVIDDKIEGRPIATPAKEAPIPAVPDLLSVLQASLAAQKPKKRGKAA